ncbi:hypothetical protein OSB04_021008 [Centaurea solstitialis]|uniref:Uncharacterized protein n=1 Tax=Centaurea solstitialis TaxID=347529 RepID=A0AA38WDU4_9ASTR|nr:hypothetical protein OSB04_021008 [Centaurea solstitialis]
MEYFVGLILVNSVIGSLLLYFLLMFHASSSFLKLLKRYCLVGNWRWRFKFDDKSLWTNLICGLYRLDGGKMSWMKLMGGRY